MPHLPRGERIDPRQVQIIHAISRTTRACWLLGQDPLSGRNFDHRKIWIENLIERFAKYFAIDVLSYAILSNHHHQLLRSRPDVVDTWDDSEVARRWLMICPKRKDCNGNPEQPSESELDLIRNSPEQLETIRLRLSNVSWWMRLLNQRIAQKANQEDDASGKFFEDRFKSIPLIDEESILACSAYIDLNWIRAGMAKTLEECEFSSIQRRVAALQVADNPENAAVSEHAKNTSSNAGNGPVMGQPGGRPDGFLAPLDLAEGSAHPGPNPHSAGYRCSDKGFLSMKASDYLELLDWFARQWTRDDRGTTPMDAPAVLQRLGLTPSIWWELIANFGSLFTTVAGLPENVDRTRGILSGCRFHLRKETRQLFDQAA